MWQMFNRQLSYFVNRLLTWNNFCEHSIFILLNKSTIKIVPKLPFPYFDETKCLKVAKYEVIVKHGSKCHNGQTKD